MKLAYLFQNLNELLSLFQSITSGVLLQVITPALSYKDAGVALGAPKKSSCSYMDVSIKPGTFLVISSFSLEGCNVNLIYEEDILSAYSTFDFDYILDYVEEASLSDKVQHLRSRTFWLSMKDIVDNCTLMGFLPCLRDTETGGLKDPGNKPNTGEFPHGFLLMASHKDVESKDIINGIEIE